MRQGRAWSREKDAKRRASKRGGEAESADAKEREPVLLCRSRVCKKVLATRGSIRIAFWGRLREMSS